MEIEYVIWCRSYIELVLVDTNGYSEGAAVKVQVVGKAPIIEVGYWDSDRRRFLPFYRIDVDSDRYELWCVRPIVWGLYKKCREDVDDIV